MNRHFFFFFFFFFFFSDLRVPVNNYCVIWLLFLLIITYQTNGSYNTYSKFFFLPGIEKFVFLVKSNASTTRSGDTVRTIEFELQKNGPYILAGLGVSGGLLLLANRNIPAINIPILSSAADRIACKIYSIDWCFISIIYSRCSSMDWSWSNRNIIFFNLIMKAPVSSRDFQWLQLFGV
jgi:hypothetical protein